MSVVLGLTEYLGKGSDDIFLCDMYDKVLHTYDDIHKAVYIIICAFVRVLFMLIQVLYY